jgi:hypothetical protein
MSTTAQERLICPECRRENEPERIYCHDCGTRLDHSALGPRKADSTETAADVHKRVSGMFDGRGVRARAFLVKSVKLLLAAGVAAALVLMLLPPPGLPPVTKSETFPPQISLDLEGLTQYHRPPQLHYSDGEVNAYLAYVLGKKKEILNHLLFDFERAFVKFHPGRCKITVGRSIFGYSIYTSGLFTAEVQGGKLNAAAESGTIGRLPIHPKLMPYANFLFGDAVRALERERKLVARVGALEMRDKEIIFVAP